MMNIILLITMYPVIFIVFFVYKSFCADENMQKKGIYFGLRAPKDEALRQEFLGLVKEQEVLFRRRMKRCLLGMFWIPLVTFLIPSMSIGFTIWMLWLIGFLGVMMLPYIYSHQALKLWKKQHMTEAFVDNCLTELKEAGKVRRVRPVSFLLPVLVSIVTGVYYTLHFHGSYAGALSFVIDTFAVMTVLYYLVALWMDRQKVMVISADSEVNRNFARAKKNLWKNLWLFCAWMNTLFTLVCAVLLGAGAPVGTTILTGSILYSLILLAAVFIAVKKVQELEGKYKEKREEDLLPDDDDHWIWGMLYYNRQDKHAMVEARFGIGTSMNLATPLGKGLEIFAALMILLLPVVCIWMILLEFTPIQLSLENRQLVAEQLNTDYEIPVDEITKLELITELPALSKYSGTAMDRLYKGSFHVTYGSDCQVFLNPENQYFLTFMAEDTLYYMSGAEDADTLALYESLRGSVQETE